MADLSEVMRRVNPTIQEPVWQHKLVYNSTSETLEPIYFWILDFMGNLGLEIEKLVDNFAASPGGGYFSELAGKATRMQEEGMKILGAVNQVIKSIINIIYDLKEFEIRLHQYDLANSKKKDDAEAGLLGLKQIWMDNVDVKRGRGSINAMTYELNFATLRDAFMSAKSTEDVDKMDLNDRVKRVLKPRISEFLEWRTRSEKELRKRFEIEKSYLKSQVNSLKLYTRWAKPYLRAAEQLMMKEHTAREPALVTAFNTILLELDLFGRKKIKVKEEAQAKKLPPQFKNLKCRDYYACVFIDFVFRGIPQRVTQSGHYVFGGRAEVSFKAYALNEEEIVKLSEELEKEDFADALKLVEAATTDSLDQLQEDLKYFIGGEEPPEKPRGFWESLAEIFGGKKQEPKKTNTAAQTRIGEIKKDSYAESVVRAYAETTAAGLCFKIYDVYKKAHGMASVPFAEE
jgi:hypothetical protein